MLNMEAVSFAMPIDDVFVLDEFIPGVIVTGHIEKGTIKPNSNVVFCDSSGIEQFSDVVDKIMSQSCLPTQEKKWLESASDAQDDYWGIALVIADTESLNRIEDDMVVIIK